MIKAIIIDDEEQNIKLLKNMLQMHCDNVEVIGAFMEAKAGIMAIKKEQPQLLFLDVEMPTLNGFDVLKLLEPINFEVIFVTAFSHYAVEAFEHNAIGYVTKPINSEKLVAAVKAAERKISSAEFGASSLIHTVDQLTQASDKIPLSTTNGLVFVKLEDVMYCESSGNYTNFFMQDAKKIMVSRQLGEYEKLLPEANFCRVHDKYIVNLKYIKEYLKGTGGELILDNGAGLPVSTRRKEDFMARFEKWLRKK
jgi:two-component system, LytTR family, response regulator